MQKKKFRWRRDWEEKYGMKPTRLNPDNGEVLGAVCLFCRKFGVEEREEDSDGREKRKRTQRAKIFNFPFRSDNFKSHVVGMHAKKYEEYEKMASEDKHDFFQLASIFKRTDTAKTKKIYVIKSAIVEQVLCELFWDFSEETEADEARARIMSSFIPSFEEGMYGFSIRNALQFRLIIDAIKLGISFRQTAAYLSSVRSSLGSCEVGHVSQRKVINVVRAVMAINFQNIGEILQSVWAFSVALDAGNNFSASFLDVRVRLFYKKKLHNLHLVALPLFVAHTGENMTTPVVKILNSICSEWKKKLFSLSSDGASSMTGRSQGVLSRIQSICEQDCSSRISRTWCGLHQLDLVAKYCLKKILENEFVWALTQLSNFLRRQHNFCKSEGRCPKFVETRWLSMRELLKWLLRQREAIETIVNEKRPTWIIDTKFWVLVYCVFAFVDTLDVAFKRLQRADITVAEQELEFKRVLFELMEVSSTKKIENCDDEPEDNCLRLGSFQMLMEDASVFIVRLGTYCATAYENLTIYEQEEVLEEVMTMFVTAVYKISEIVVERDEENKKSGRYLSPMPSDLLKLDARQFHEHLQEQTDRLSAYFEPKEIQKIEEEFRLFSLLPFRDPGMAQLIENTAGMQFEQAWEAVGDKFGYLKSFVSAFATIFPNTATVESDFSVIKFEKNDRRQRLTNMSLEGILQCKQFQLVQELLGKL